MNRSHPEKKNSVIDTTGKNPVSHGDNHMENKGAFSTKIVPQAHRVISHEQIAKMAYVMWQKHGSQNGVEVETWLNAEKQLKKEHRQS